MHYRWEGTDNEGIIRSLSWRLYQVGIRWWSAAPGFGKFAFAERRAPRANLRPSAATILSPMWRSPTLGSGPGVGRDVGKGATRARYFPPILVVRPYFFFFKPFEETADFVIRKSGSRTRESIRRRVYLRPDRCRDAARPQCLSHRTTIGGSSRQV